MTTTTDTNVVTTEVDTRRAYTASLRALADLLDANPDLIDDVRYVHERQLVPVNHADDPRERMAAFIRAGKAAGFAVRKDYDENYGSVDINLGAFLLHVYASRERVCERVVTGTREVTREVQDPEALKAVPTTTVTETVEDVEWVCLPLLADVSVSA